MCCWPPFSSCGLDERDVRRIFVPGEEKEDEGVMTDILRMLDANFVKDLAFY